MGTCRVGTTCDLGRYPVSCIQDVAWFCPKILALGHLCRDDWLCTRSHGRLLAYCFACANADVAERVAASGVRHPRGRMADSSVVVAGAVWTIAAHRHGDMLICRWGLGILRWSFLAMSYSALARWRPLVDLVEKHYPLFVAGFVFASLPEVLIVMRELVGAMRAVFIDAMLALPQVSSELVLEQPSVFWLALGTMALFMILSDWSKPVFRVLAGLAVLVTLLISGLSWVALLRPEYRPLVGSDEPPTLLREAIPPGSLTYMEGGHGYLWFVLGRPSYASHHQAAGVIFRDELRWKRSGA